MHGVALSSVLQFLLVLGCALTALKLFLTGLYKKYPFFFAYIVFRIFNSIWPLQVNIKSAMYFYLYIGTLPVVLLFYVFAVREIYRLVLEDYRGLQTLGRWGMYASLICAVLLSVLTLLPTIKPSAPQRSNILGLVFGAERWVETTLALFIILLLAFLSRYPIQLRRNVRTHAVVYSIFFLATIGEVLIRTTLGLKDAPAWALASTIMNLGCILSWLILLSPAGETVPLKDAAAASANERRLLLQLEGFNATLLRVSRPKVG